MNNITLKQLRYLDALARHRHFGRAAEASSISQPALSVQIKSLEAELGAALFDRGPRDVRVTNLGEQILQRAQSILRSVEELSDFARTAQDRLVGRLRLGIIPTIAPYLLPALIGRLSQEHFGIDVHVRETLTPTLIQELLDGKLDTAIVALPVSESSLTEIALFSERFVLVRPKGHGDRPVPSADELREMRLLLLEEGHCFRDQALSFCNIQSVLMRDGLDASSLSTLVQMVSAGIGVTLVPEMAVRIESRSADVDVTSFPAPEPSRTIGMVWRKTSPMGDALTKIADEVRIAGEEMQSKAGS
ncbi:MAG: LysR substrate-binding domain-containing protein [Paracoccaceae bacterium]